MIAGSVAVVVGLHDETQRLDRIQVGLLIQEGQVGQRSAGRQNLSRSDQTATWDWLGYSVLFEAETELRVT